MDVRIQVPGLNPNTRLDLKKEDATWTLWNNTESLQTGIVFDDNKLGLDHYKVIVNDDAKSVRIIRFADLHRHSDNSLKDGIIKVPDMVEHTEYAGALTDHGNMYGFLEFYKSMNAAGKHPIIGFEAYVETTLGKLERNHLILLAKNDQGYRNLLKLTSESFDHFYRAPHVTWDMLEKYHEGVIATSACIGGLIPNAILNGDMELAISVLKKFLSLFGDDFYLEIQRHNIPEEKIVNPQLIRLAKEFHVPLIATTDSHYLYKEDAFAHEVTLCLQTGKKMDEPHMQFKGTGYHMHTSAEMEELFSDLPEALDNTILLAEKCHVNVPLGEVNLPNYQIPDGFETPFDYFKYLCEEGFKNRFKGKPELNDPKYLERFHYELNVVKEMGFASYFIIVQDFINYARKVGVYIGPGRGSAAGSLLAYCMGITDMDPIRFNLLFERFLNPERVSWPDVDTDIEHVGRQKVIDYITKKYGAESVCRIVTFGTMAAKMVLKDVARVLGYKPGWANALAKMVPSDTKMTLKKALESNPELRHRYETEPDVRKIIDIAKTLEGNKRHSSQHACGLVCAPGNVDNFLPTSMEIDTETGEKGLTSQVVMTEVEDLSLLKMDLLGLKNLTAIHEVITTIKRTRGVHIRYQDIPLNDRATYQMLAKGITGGVFQLESVGMTKVVTQMLSDVDDIPDDRIEECFERLIAAVALYRPGPMDYIPDYVAGMHDPKSIHYDCPEEETILAPTFGVMVYQEQLMQIAQTIAGYSLGEADILRKACGKKKQSLMDKEHGKFVFGNQKEYDAKQTKHLIPGCVGNGIREDVAEGIWNKMTKFASYAFNRSHAACYAWIAYITAYMSCHWTPEFYCAMLNAFEDVGDKVKGYLATAAKRGITILPPDINQSQDKCTVEGESIRLGFRPLNHLNKFSKSIIKERKANGPFTDYQNFYERMCDSGNRPNKAIIESLVFSGSLDKFGLNKAQLLKFTDMLEKDYKLNAVNRNLGQFSLFDSDAMRLRAPQMEEFHPKTLMDEEFKAIGFYLSSHPVDELSRLGPNIPNYISISDLAMQESPLKNIVTFGLIHDLKQLFTKKDDEMYVFTVEDRYNSIRCVLFPSRVAANRHRLMDGAVVKIVGSFEVDEDHGNQIIVQDLSSSEEAVKQNSKSVTVTVRNKEEQTQLLEFVHKNPGEFSVRILANGRTYPIKRKVNLTARTVDYLKTHFSKVSI